MQNAKCKSEERKRKVHSNNFFISSLLHFDFCLSPSFFTFAFCILTSAFILGACSAKNDPWSLQTMRTGSSTFDSSKLACVSPDRVNGLDLEILSSEGEVRIALIAHSHPVAPYALDGKKVLVKISSAQKKIVTLAGRREGGQRLILPEETHSFILSTLKDGEPLTFQVPGYKTTVESGKFSAHLEKMKHPPFEVIIHLPM